MAQDASPHTENYFIGKGNVYWKALADTAYRHVGNVPTFELTLNLEQIEHFSSMEGVKVRDDIIVTQQTGTLHMVLEEGTGKNFGLALMADPAQAVSGAVTFATLSSSTAISNLTPVSSFVSGRRYWLTSNSDVGSGNSFIYAGGSAGVLESLASSTNSASSATAAAPVAMTVFEEAAIEGSIKFVGANDVGARVLIEALNVKIKPSAAISLIGDTIGNMTLDADVLRDDYSNFAQFYWNIGSGAPTGITFA